MENRFRNLIFALVLVFFYHFVISKTVIIKHGTAVVCYYVVRPTAVKFV